MAGQSLVSAVPTVDPHYLVHSLHGGHRQYHRVVPRCNHTDHTDGVVCDLGEYCIVARAGHDRIIVKYVNDLQLLGLL